MTKINVDAAAHSVEIAAHNCFLYAHQVGQDVHVYRSTRLRDESKLYRSVAALVGHAELIHHERVEDRSMMGYQAEHLVYRLDYAAQAAA